MLESIGLEDRALVLGLDPEMVLALALALVLALVLALEAKVQQSMGQEQAPEEGMDQEVEMGTVMDMGLVQEVVPEPDPDSVNPGVAHTQSLDILILDKIHIMDVAANLIHVHK